MSSDSTRPTGAQARCIVHRGMPLVVLAALAACTDVRPADPGLGGGSGGGGWSGGGGGGSNCNGVGGGGGSYNAGGDPEGRANARAHHGQAVMTKR